MKQSRIDLAAEVTRPFGPFRSAKARLGFGDYAHSELSGEWVNTTFANESWEGRLELPHQPVGPVAGTIGLQMARSDFSAVGEEVVTPPWLTRNAAVFALEEWPLEIGATVQFGGRYELQSVNLGEVDSSLPPVSGYAARSGQTRRMQGASASLGVVFRPAQEWSVGSALTYSERLPTAQELFSHGPHGGTGTYEVGTSELGNEKSLGLDLNVRRRAGFITGAVGAFVNKFEDFIFEEELPLHVIPPEHNEESLTPVQFVARDALFLGLEAELTFHLIDKDTRQLHLELTSDYVRAEETNRRAPLPRITPLRHGARLTYQEGPWAAGLEIRRISRQRRITRTETPTPGYTLIHFDASYRVHAGRGSYELFARANNIGNVAAREHTSFLKDFAPLPGIGITGGVRMSF